MFWFVRMDKSNDTITIKFCKEKASGATDALEYALAALSLTFDDVECVTVWRGDI